MKQLFKIITTIALLIVAITTKAQYCINFDGSNDYVSINNYASLQTTSKITVEAWINATAWKTPLYKGTVLSMANNIGQNNGFDLRAGEGGKAEFNISIGGNWVTATSAAIMQTGQWYHLAGVYTGDSVMIYVNGVMRAATPVTGSITYSTGKLYIAECPGWTARTFSGKIDEVRFWNIARTHSQLTNTICSSLIGNETGLVGYWKFNANNGTTTAINSVSGANNGTLTNMTLASAWVNSDYICSLNNPDVGVENITSPASGFNLTATEQVKVKITNYSNQAASNFPVSYKLGSNAAITETVTASIPAFGSYIYTFTQVLDLSAYQNYSLQAYTSQTGDVVASNNSFTKTISNFATGSNFGVDFDGVDDEIAVNNTGNLNPTNALTVEAWINADSWKNATFEGSIVAKEQGSPDRGYVLRCGSNGRVEFQLSDNGSWKSVSSPPILKINRWYHIAAAFDGSTVKLYVNGELIASSVCTSILPSTVGLMIGENPSYNGRNFDGKIDEVRIWNIGRTASQIQNNMTASLTGSETGLVAYYKLNEGLGNSIAADATVNGQTGTLNNFDLPNAWVSGYSVTNNDAAVCGLVAPNNLTAFNGPSRVKVEIKNTGANTISNIPVSYTIGTGTPFLDTIKTSIAPNEIYTHSFHTIENFSSLTSVNIKTKVKLNADSDMRNDSLITTLTKPSVSSPNSILAINAVQHNFDIAGQTHYTDVVFPEAPEEYSQILMYISVACPATGCDPWDQAGKISVFKNGEEYELGRFVTPYGKACGPWSIDVTDFKSLLSGKVTLQSYLQVWGASGWLLSVSFEFIKGNSAFPYSKVTPLWNNDYVLYGDPAISYNLPLLTIPVDSKTRNARIRTTITGHGQGNTDNAAEFSQKIHHVWLNGVDKFSHNLWKADCGSNTCSNQSGTWTLSRAGWCPGQGVNSFTNDLTPFVTSGQNMTLDYVLQSYTNLQNTGYDGGNHTEPYYRIHTYFIESSDTAKTFSDFKNLATTKITSPVYSQTLTANEVVKAVIINKGTVSMTNPVVSYYLNGIKKETDTIAQTIVPGDSIIYIFTQSANMAAQGNYTINVLLTVTGDINATDDIATLNINQLTGINELNKSMELSVIPNPSEGEVSIRVNGIEGKTKITIYDLQGHLVYNEEALSKNGLLEENITIKNKAKGMYFLCISSDQGIKVEKIIIK